METRVKPLPFPPVQRNLLLAGQRRECPERTDAIIVGSLRRELSRKPGEMTP